LDEKIFVKKLEKDINEGKSLNKENHFKYLKSCFDYVQDENELRDKHEENMKLVIENLIANNPIGDEEKEETIKKLTEDFDEDFQYVLILYRHKKKNSRFEHKKALENAKHYYVSEMDKQFKEPKFIITKDLQTLHEKFKSLAHDKLKEELPAKRVNPIIDQQFNETIEVIFDQYKRQNLTYMPVKQAIGIDLGTTYCCVGVMNRGKVHIIAHGSGMNTIPSCVSFNQKGEAMIGSDAKEESYENPANTIYDVKRMIGRKYSDQHIQNDMKLWPFKVVDVNDSLKIQLFTNLEEKKRNTFYPEEVSAKILKKLKKDAEDFLGYEVKNAVITVPAYFNDAQRQATKDAGNLAGLNVLQILNEPTAAAIAYCHQIKDDFRKNILIYDLGGGTFDVAVVVIDKGDIDVRAVGGDTHLGGVDFDQRIMNYICRKYEENFLKCSDENGRKRAMARLKIQCEQKKWILSGVNTATINISQLLPGWDLREVLKQSNFENLCMDFFKKTITIVDETLKSAKISKSDIDEIVLIGGSVKIPKIQSLLREYFNGKALNKEIKTDEAVAYGATIQAALLNGEKFKDSISVIPHDVAPFSLGIELLDKSMAVIIHRNTKLPTENTQKCYTSRDNQTYVYIQIFEGENTKTAKLNRLLGDFVIDGLPEKPAGQVQVDVTFRIDEEGILHVKGETSEKSATLTIEDHRGRISPEELKKLINQVCYLFL